MNPRHWKALCSALLLVSFVFSNFGGAEAEIPFAPTHVGASGRTSGLVKGRATSAAPASTLFGDPLSESATPANAWLPVGDACLTAGTAATPATSIPACGTTAPLDPSGGGALQLTPGTGNSSGMVVYKTPVSTAGGLQISFTDDSFNGSTPGADGVTLFLSDASAPIPTVMGNTGGSLGYADGSNNTPTGAVAPGIANGYLGIAFDEFGYFSNPTQGRVGGPGQIPETIAVRGAAASGYQYIGGAENTAGAPASLPFDFDTPAAATRPANAPTITATLTAAGLLTVGIDHHDGNGTVARYSQTVVGVNGQPAVPANVYIGLTASTGGYFNRHQITGFSVAGAGTAPSQPAAPALSDPQQIRSYGGQLVFNVVASQASNGSPQFVYNGSPVPPTLRLLPGDTLHVNLTNNLPTPPAGAGYLNDTNLHYHGLHVNPNAPGDDSIDMIAMPGQTLNYQITIPATHPSGIYWYHSHAHGEAERQNLSGMSGALIIDGIAKYAPQVANLAERILVVRDTVPTGQVLPAADKRQVNAMLWAMRHGNAASAKLSASKAYSKPELTRLRNLARLETSARMQGMSKTRMSMDTAVRGNTTAKTRNPYVDVNPSYDRFVRPAASTHCLAGTPEAPSRNWTLNGQTNPSIGIAPGEKQFWRLVNAGSDTYLDVSVDNTQMQIVGLDGVPLASVGNALMTVSHYVVPPSSRLEFIVTGPPAGTLAYLRTNCFDSGATGLAMPAATLASINPAGSSLGNILKHRDRLIGTTPPYAPSRTRQASAATAGRIHTVAYIRSFIKTHAIARTQVLTYSSQNQINGQSYDPAGPPQFYAQSGTMEQWQIVNGSSEVHTFHIHQTHFLVQSIVGGTAIEQSNVGQELDNINVPAATATGPGSVTLIMDFTDPLIIGTFLLHCHILSHEDQGMMAKIRVGTAPPLTTTAPAQGLSFASPTAAAQNIVVSGGQAPFSVSGCTNVANASVTGATVTIAPAGAGGCTLIVADASGLTASVAIDVTGVAPRISIAPNSFAFAATTAAAQTATVAGGTPPYAATGCTNVAAASFTGGTLTVAPVGVGSCTLTVTDAAADSQVASVSVNAPLTGNAADNDTFHNNNARQGWNQSERTLTAANVNAANFGKLDYLTGSGYGKVYSQPLFASNESVGGTAHNLVIVSTATDQVIAYDDQTLQVVWQRSFTNPAAGITQQSWGDTECQDVDPDIGITGTPVIDRSLDRMYVVVPTKENGAFHIRLHAISLQTGADALAPTEVSASVMLSGNTGTATTDPQWNFNRGALLEANGSIYVALGSHCDYHQFTTHGWVLAYSAASLAPVGSVINTTNAQAGYYLGSPWMAGYGPAADSNGNVYFATGNGPWDGVNAFSMSVLKVPGNLNIGNGSYFTPSNEAQASENDFDLGSGGVMLLPDGLSASFPHVMVAGGKTGQKWLLNRDKMGGQQARDAGSVWQGTIGGPEWGGPAFFQDATGKAYVVYGDGSPFATYLYNPANSSLSLASSVTVPGGCLECRNSGSQPVVSSNGTTAGSAIVWVLQTPNNGGNISLMAFNALSMQTLYTGLAGGWYPGAGVPSIAGALVSPLVANGKVYVPTDGGVAVFGLKSTAAARTLIKKTPNGSIVK
jgi:FtsP/CotA-like multicopper oxidase with cupredoxin domain